jgi:hypothetical protein
MCVLGCGGQEHKSSTYTDTGANIPTPWKRVRLILPALAKSDPASFVHAHSGATLLGWLRYDVLRDGMLGTKCPTQVGPARRAHLHTCSLRSIHWPIHIAQDLHVNDEPGVYLALLEAEVGYSLSSWVVCFSVSLGGDTGP